VGSFNLDSQYYDSSYAVKINIEVSCHENAPSDELIQLLLDELKIISLDKERRVFEVSSIFIETVHRNGSRGF